MGKLHRLRFERRFSFGAEISGVNGSEQLELGARRAVAAAFAALDVHRLRGLASSYDHEGAIALQAQGPGQWSIDLVIDDGGLARAELTFTDEAQARTASEVLFAELQQAFHPTDGAWWGPRTSCPSPRLEPSERRPLSTRG